MDRLLFLDCGCISRTWSKELNVDAERFAIVLMISSSFKSSFDRVHNSFLPIIRTATESITGFVILELVEVKEFGWNHFPDVDIGLDLYSKSM